MYVYVEKVCVSIISSLYQYLFVSAIMAILFMILYDECKKHGIKNIFYSLLHNLKTSKEHRRVFILAIYTCLILFRTVFCRQIWGNPIDNVLGNWSFHFSDGSISTELIENLFLFIPFSMLALWALRMRILNGQFTFKNICCGTIKIAFLFSTLIELCQIFLRVGTFQISDLITNTMGGLLGGVIYYICYKFKHRK